MQFRIIKNGIFIIPETEFELEYIKQFQIENLKAFVKTGVNLTDILGLKIVIESKENIDGN